MKIVDAKKAIANYRAGRPFSAWCRHGEGYDTPPASGNGGARIHKDFLELQWSPKFHISPDASFFAAGSCFARNVEQALINAGVRVLSRDPSVSHDALHRYNTFSILRDFDLALSKTTDSASYVEARPGKWIDYTGHESATSKEELDRQRRACVDLHSRILETDALVITLGLVEAWFDREASSYLNIAPNDLMHRTPDRYELRVTDYGENLDALQFFWSRLRDRVQREIKLIVTVSPVPFTATFAGQDVVLANTYSKSVLRAVAQDFCDAHQDAMYFPSYEMATLSDPGSVWRSDQRHVTPEFVQKIMSFFVSHCIK